MRLRLLIAFLLLALPMPAFAELVVGLTTTNQLVVFDSATPGIFQSTVLITGIVPGDTIEAIDRRPATGESFALGVNGTTAHLYTIDATTGVATQVGGNIALPQSGGVVGPETAFGFDFNPVVDIIRVVANNRDNFRLNPNTGAVAAADIALNPGTPVIVGAAYTNNFAGATSTTLYAIATSTGAPVCIGGNPAPPGMSPNGGVVTFVGPLGVIPSSNEVGFEISPSGIAFAALQVGGVSSLYTINLSTGAVTLVGGFSGGTVIRDITSFSDVVTPIPALSPLAQALIVVVIGVSGLLFLRRRPSLAG